MTSEVKSQLAILRRRITRINHKYNSEAVGGAAPPGRSRPPGRLPASESEPSLPGEPAENHHGRYWQAEKFFPNHRRHGTVEFSRLSELSAELLPAISSGELPASDPRRWAFLDTETTGLSGGAGTCAFLAGVGTVEDSGFRVRLFFMRDYDEEAAMLSALASYLANYDVLITYNGKAYDAPLLESRYRLSRLPLPLDGLAHLDLLFAARRLWRLRLETCRLVDLEYEILGFEREGDLPGELIPYYYFEYLRTREAFRLVPLFHHNTMDIVTLAALAAVILPVFSAPAEASLHHGEDLLGLARWLHRNARPEDALSLYRRAIDLNMRDQNLFRALWETALLEKKLGHKDEALRIWCDLAAVKNEFRTQALESLAKHYEHTERNHAMALEMTAAAIAIEALPQFERRKQRLERKLAKQSRRLL